MPLITKGCFKTALSFTQKEKMLALLCKVSAILENDKNDGICFRIFPQSTIFPSLNLQQRFIIVRKR